MAIFSFRDRSPQEAPKALVVHALRDAARIGPSHVVRDQVSGGNLAGRHTRRWVQVNPLHGDLMTIKQEADGPRVTCLVKSHVDMDAGMPLSDGDHNALEQLARQALDEELTPRLVDLGMACAPGTCWGGEEDDHGGCAVERRESVVPDAKAAIALVRATDTESCRRAGLAV